MPPAIARLVVVPLLLGHATIAKGEDPTSGESARPDTEGEWSSADHAQVFDTRLYGYVDSYWEQVAKTPAGVGDEGDTVWESNPYEFDVLNLHAMVQGTIAGRYRFYLNLAAPGAGSNTDDEPLGVRNAWVEVPLYQDWLQLRLGKTYRRFGLYNEILDATPTFIGIEPPELFDKDHLMVTRTTNLMAHGAATLSAHSLSWALMTGNDERAGNSIPVGADLRLDLFHALVVGSSFYTTGGDAGPTRAVGEGSPKGGVANWMARDRYSVYGGYAQLAYANVIVQAEVWEADHSAQRDPDAMATLGQNADLNSRQLARFFVDGDPNNGLRGTDVDYKVRTYYLRLGYDLTLGGKLQLTPYAQMDFYHNRESIKEKDFGGDNEAGLSDDGEFWKVTAGAVLRPVPQVALKVDGSSHFQQFNSESTFYPEIRVSLSYLWQLDF